MTMLFIHGIVEEPVPANQGIIVEKWRNALLRHDVDGKIKDEPTVLAYYSDILAAHSGSIDSTLHNTIFDHPISSAGFTAEAVAEVVRVLSQRHLKKTAFAPGANLGDLFAPVQNLLTPVRPNAVIFEGNLRVLIKRFLLEADTYFTEPAAAAAIDSQVRQVLKVALADGARPIIIAHSLGSAIAYKLLSQMSADYAPSQIPLLITMGSPLALKAVRRRLPIPFKRPAIVGQWRNFYDQGDVIAAGSPIPVNGDAAITNHFRVGLPFPKHLADDYLHDRVLAGHLLAAL